MRILAINCGSSSLKFKLFDGEKLRTEGRVERIGEENGPFPDHHAAVRHAVGELAASGRPDAVGHRLVHGGEAFGGPVRVDAPVIERIRALAPLAPLHNLPGLAGIEAAGEAWPEVPQVAVFDTSFHRTMPPAAHRYALPNGLCEAYGVRRYGFHGISHRFVAERAAAYLARPPEKLNLVTLHLGHGASATAIRGGRSVDTSMGMTPLEGLMMGTRCGDLDPAVPGYLARVTGRTASEIDRLLNRESGLKGVCGARDMREVHRMIDAGDESAQLAFDMFCHRLRKYIGAYTAVLGRVDALVFTGGIGERDARTRAAACAGLEEGPGIRLDADANRDVSGGPAAIHAPESRIDVLVVPTDEELAVARRTRALLGGAGRREGDLR